MQQLGGDVVRLLTADVAGKVIAALLLAVSDDRKREVAVLVERRTPTATQGGVAS